jgi:hypothetical protein
VWAVGLTVLGLVGCAAGPNTLSGRPEVVVAATKPEVREALVSEFGKRGYGVLRSDESTVEMSRDADSVAKTILWGFGDRDWRLTFSLAAVSSSVEVYGRVEYVEARDGMPFTATERFDKSDGKAGAQVQEILESMWPAEKVRVRRPAER